MSASVASDLDTASAPRGVAAEKIAIFAAKLLVTGACFWYVSGQIDFARVLSAAPLVDFRWAAFAVLVFLLQIPLVALRWRNVLAVLVKLDERMTRAAMIAVTTIGVFFAQVLPGVMGEGVRAWLLVRLGCDWRNALTSVVIDRGIGVGLLLALGFVILLLPSGLTALGGYRQVVLVVYGALLLAGVLGLLLVPIIAPLLARWRYSRWIAALAMDARRVLLGARSPDDPEPWMSRPRAHDPHRLVARTRAGPCAAGCGRGRPVHRHGRRGARSDFGRRLGSARARGGIAPVRPRRRARTRAAVFGVLRPRVPGRLAAGGVPMAVVSAPPSTPGGAMMAESSGKVALITGVTGQDGAYLAELLLAKGYEVHGVKRRVVLVQHRPHRPSLPGPARARTSRFHLHYGDLTDATNLIRIVQETQPDEIYNLAAQSHVQVSFETPEYTANADALGTLRLLEAIRILGLGRQDPLLPGIDLRALRQGAGNARRRETTPFYPRSPYAAAKLYAYWITVNYREAYGMSRLQRHPVQPREPAARRDLRHPQDHARGRRDRARAAGPALSRQPRRPARLGPCARLRRGHVADAAAATTPTTTCSPPARAHSVREFVELRLRRDRPRASSGAATGVDENGRRPADRPGAGRDRSALLPPDRGRYPARRPEQGARASSAGAHKTSFGALVAEMVEADMVAIRRSRSGATGMT